MDRFRFWLRRWDPHLFVLGAEYSKGLVCCARVICGADAMWVQGALFSSCCYAPSPHSQYSAIRIGGMDPVLPFMFVQACGFSCGKIGSKREGHEAQIPVTKIKSSPQGTAFCFGCGDGI